MLLAELTLFDIISRATYFALAGVALWGLYCIVIVWTRVNQKRFKTEQEQDRFMDDVEQMLVDADLVAHFDVVVVLDPNAALGPCLHLVDVVFETTQRLELTLVDDDVVA